MPRMKQRTSPNGESVSHSFCHHNDRCRAGTIRDPAGCGISPHIVGAHLTQPTPLSPPPLVRRAPSPAAVPFPGGALSLAVAQDYRLRFARPNIAASIREFGSASGTPEAASPPRAARDPRTPSPRTPPIWTIVFPGTGDHDRFTFSRHVSPSPDGILWGKSDRRYERAMNTFVFCLHHRRITLNNALNDLQFQFRCCDFFTSHFMHCLIELYSFNAKLFSFILKEIYRVSRNVHTETVYSWCHCKSKSLNTNMS